MVGQGDWLLIWLAVLGRSRHRRRVNEDEGKDKWEEEKIKRIKMKRRRGGEDPKLRRTKYQQKRIKGLERRQERE